MESVMAKIGSESRKVLLDFGTHQGEGLHKLIAELGVDETWEIYTFEANPYTYHHFANLREKLSAIPEVTEKLPWLLWENITYSNKAVWKEDIEMVMSCVRDVHETITLADLYGEPELEHMSFLLATSWLSGGSTLLSTGKDKELDQAGHRMTPTVSAIDITAWMKENFSEDVYIAMKMDIEGAEGKVLQQMINEGVIDYVNWITVEWHLDEYITAHDGPKPELLHWLKGWIDGYLTCSEKRHGLHVSSWQ